MNIWLIKTGEPVPVADRKLDRLHRVGSLADVLASRGHRVIWWTSTFDHYGRTQFYQEDTDWQRDDLSTIRMLRGCGYRRNVSIARIREHRTIAAKFAVRARLEQRPDIILCAYPTIEFSLAAVRYGLEYRVPVVLDIRDLHPDVFVEMLPRWGRPFARALLLPARRSSRQACAGATAISGITEPLLDWGLKRAGRERTEWDRCFPLGYQRKVPEAAARSDAERYWDDLGVRADGSFRACFLGTMGQTLNVQQILGAAGRLIGESGTQFVLCGSGERLAFYRKNTEGLVNVIFPGRVNAAQMHVLMERSSVGLDPLPDRFDFLATINNKAIEYLSAGLPVLSCPTRGVLCDLLSTEGCGTSWEAGNDADLARVLVKLTREPETVRQMATRAKILFRERFDAALVYGNMADYLERLAVASK